MHHFKSDILRYSVFSMVLFYVAIIIAYEYTQYQTKSTMIEHIEWITENTSLEYNGETLPTVERRTADDMAAMFYGLDEDPNNHSENDRKVVKNSNVGALYNFRTNTLYFKPDFRFDDWETTHILVHELVHFLQMTNNRYGDDPCMPRLEGYAYMIQTQWQEEHNHPADIPNGLRIMTLIAAGC